MTTSGDRANPHTVRAMGLYVWADDPELQAVMAPMLQQLASSEKLRAQLAQGDPLAAVARDDGTDSEGQHLLGILVTSSDDDTLDAVADVMERFGRDIMRRPWTRPIPRTR